MKVTIDPKGCVGHGLCYADAPNVFVDDDEGYGQIIGDGTVPDSEVGAARHAAANCPERAISLTE